MRAVLDAVSKTDMDYFRLPEDWLIAHRSEGEACRCRGEGRIEKSRIGGRSAWFCPAHQTRP